MSNQEGLSIRLTGKKVKVTNVITAALILAIILIIIFLWTYYQSINPLEELKAKFLPIRQPPKWVATIYGEESVYLNQPRSVYVYNREIYVSDTGNHRVVVFDDNGKYLRKFGDTGDRQQRLMYPYGLAVVGNEVLVSDAGLNRVAVFDLNGRFRRFFPVKISRPISVVYQSGKLYFTDIALQQVVVTDTEGNELVRTGRSGRSAAGEFYYPNGLTVASDGRIFVADTNNRRVQVLDPQGKFLEKWGGGPDKGEGYFTAPTGIALDREGNAYVVDPINRWVSIIDPKGNLLTVVQQVGKPEEGDALFLPTGVWVDDRQHLYVADYSASRIIIYDLL